jgi:hypothetical protein
LLLYGFLLLLFLTPGLPTSSALAAVAKKLPSRADYVGDRACGTCHQAQAKNYADTAHHFATSWPTPKIMKGHFTPDKNIMRTSNPYLHFEMTSGPNGYFQSAVEEPGPGKRITRTERIDIVSGIRKGQSYIFWKGDLLFQLPVTYWTETDSWVNSPSYPDGSPHFDKDIIPRCLECHATYFEWAAPPVNRYKKSSLLLGIMCEKCHGPGKAHVALHRTKSELPAGTPEQIMNPSKLERDRQIDMCGLCHSGNGTPIQPSLSFQPGDDLRDYIDFPYVNPETAVDVHGNQVQLLRKSKCFQASAMTCTTCHDVHTNQRDADSFSPKCLGCHQAKQCGEYSKLGESIASNCVDCHMPLQESHALFSQTNGKRLQPKVRNHTIAIYPSAQTR